MTPPSVLVLPEWKSTIVPSLVLHAEDRKLVDSLGERIEIVELRQGLSIRTKSWVGVVRFSQFELHIVPKLAGGNFGLVRLIEFASGFDSLKRHPASHTLEAQGSNLLDLLGFLLAEACERIARSGLLYDYCELEDDLPVVRGRLLVRKQVLARFGRVDRVECRYDEHTSNTIENQIVLAALIACCKRVRHAATSLRIRRLLSVFSEACDLDEVDLRVARATLVYNRLNERYREAHGLAWLILEALGIEDLYASGERNMFAFLLNMNRLFEEFVASWLALLLKGTSLRAIPQRGDHGILWNADLAKPYARVIPDFAIESKNKPGFFLPLDAKYKLYDEKHLSPGDIYQTFLYAYAYGQHHKPLPSALILYPASTGSPGALRLQVRRGGVPHAELVSLGIDIPKALDEASQGKISSQGQLLRTRIEACFGTGSACVPGQ